MKIRFNLATKLAIVTLSLGSLASVAGAQSDAKTTFQKTCVETMMKNVKTTKLQAETGCECIVKKIAPKLSDAEFKTLTSAYKGTLTAAEEAIEETSVLLNYELEVAMSCVGKSEDKKTEASAN